MNTERTIRNQAKKLLEGNWITIIASIAVLCASLILMQSILLLTMFVCNVIDFNTFEIIKSKEWIAGCIFIGIYFLAFLLSPLINGIYKIVCNISINQKGYITDIFYFFGRRKYIKTLCLNLVISTIFFLVCTVFDFYSYVSYFAETMLKENPFFGIIINILLAVLWMVSEAAKIFAYLVFVHYSLIAYSFNDSMQLKEYVIGMYSFSFRNLGAALKMLLGFAGWIALCFFVVPALYVLPYIMTSMTVSAKWLFALDKDRGLLC